METREIIDLVLNFLEIIISWPFSFGLVSLIFVYKFSQEIKKFLNDVVSIKAGGFEAHRQSEFIGKDLKEEIGENLENQGIVITPQQLDELEENIANLSKERDEKEKEVLDKENSVKYYQEKAEVYEFAYLSIFLVENSKKALNWFYKQFNYSSTKENFLGNFLLSADINDPQREKEAIFNALLVNQLIILQEGLYVVTEKAERFLKYIGFIK